MDERGGQIIVASDDIEIQNQARSNIHVNKITFIEDMESYYAVADDVVYTSHSLEPNGDREVASITELLRVARKTVVLVEPLYELASELAQKRMAEHGYVRGLKFKAEKLGAGVVEYGLLDVCSNPLNPSGVVLMVKTNPAPRRSVEIGGRTGSVH